MAWPSRRNALALGVGAIGSAALGHLSHAATPSDTTLAAAAKANHLIFGAAGGSELFTDTAYRDLFIREAAILTPDHALKFRFPAARARVASTSRPRIP